MTKYDIEVYINSRLPYIFRTLASPFYFTTPEPETILKMVGIMRMIAKESHTHIETEKGLEEILDKLIVASMNLYNEAEERGLEIIEIKIEEGDIVDIKAIVSQMAENFSYTTGFVKLNLTVYQGADLLPGILN